MHCSSIPNILSFSVMRFSLMKHIDVSHEISASFFRISFGGSIPFKTAANLHQTARLSFYNDGNLCIQGHQILKYRYHNISNLPGGMKIKAEYTNKILI